METSLKKYFLAVIILITNIFTTDIKSQTSITEETAFLWNLKLDTLPNHVFTEEYLYRFQKESFRLFKNDEFEMRRATESLNEAVENLDKNSIYTVKYLTNFSEYDFDKKGFICTPFPDDIKIPLLDYVFGTRLPTNSAVNVSFLNGEEISLMPMEEDRANTFLKERKNYKNGKVDRGILVNIHFVISGMYITDNVSNKSVHTLTTKILQVDFHDNNELENHPISIATTSYKTAFDSEEKIKEEYAQMENV